MKTLFTFLGIALLCIIFNPQHTKAQNTFPGTGNVGIGTLSPATALQVIGATRLGSAVNYIGIDPNGSLTFTGTAAYKVANNRYAFQAAVNANIGLYFNASGNAIEYRNSVATTVASVNLPTGNGYFLGSLGVGTLTPASKLDVNGDALINGITIGRGGGAVSYNTVNGLAALSSNTTGSDNTATGYATLHFNTTGVGNTANGFFSLWTNTTGFYNTANGYNALLYNTMGHSNTASGDFALYQNTIGDYNTAYGDRTLLSNTTGNANTASGSSALYYNTTGGYNTANGVATLNANTTGGYNTANGFSALYSNTTGYSNVGIGTYSLYSNTGTPNLVAVGDSAMYSNKTGMYNTAIGSKALKSNTIGNNNTANGFNTLFSNTTGSNNTANGYRSLLSNTTGNNNTANGYNTLFLNTTGSNNTANGVDVLIFNTTGFDNTANGYQSLYSNVTGYGNAANGYQSLYLNTTGHSNVANGYYALYSNTIGHSNVANGDFALYVNNVGDYNTANGESALVANTIGNANTANGSQSLFNNTNGDYNTANGVAALFINDTGNYNTANGYQALMHSTGSFNTALGYGADVGFSPTALTNAMALGNTAIVNASNKVQIGNSSVTVIGGQVGWSILSDGRFKSNIKENVPGLAFINKLKPVTYNLELQKFDRFVGKKDSLINVSKTDYSLGEKKVRSGFIAQDVEKAAQELQYDFDGVNHPQNDKDNYSLVYADFVPSLVKGIQELSKINEAKDKTIDTLRKENADLLKQFADLKSLILSIQQKLDGCSPCSVNGAFSLQSYSIASSYGSSLEQNTPNPFTHSTSIGYILPKQYTKAQILITDKNGKTFLTKDISGTGKGRLNVDLSVLSSGSYNYSLLIDGKLIGTKQMVLAK